MNTRVLAAGLLSCAALIWAQDTPVIRVSTTLVQVDALVTDSSGRHISDLTPADFTVSEDGKPQRITNFSYVTGSEAKVSRAIAIVVDDYDTSAANLSRMRPDLIKFAENQIGPGDRVSISNVSNAATKVDFTNDRAALRTAIERATMGGGGSIAAPSACPMMLGHFNAAIDRISVAIRSLRGMPGRKALVLMSDGISLPVGCPLEGERARLEMTRLADQAVRAGVSLYAQDTRGLATDHLDASFNSAAPAGTVLPGGPGDAMAIFVQNTNSQKGLQAATQRLRNADIGALELPEYLTSQTGGIFAYGHNDLLEALDKSLDDMSGYYLIGFQPAASDFELKNGGVQWHRVEVQLKGRGLLVRSTKGFAGTPGGYATDGVSTGPPDEVKQEIDEVFVSGEQRDQLPVRLRAEFFKDGDQATVTVTARIDAARLPFRKEDGRNRNDLTLVVGLFDQNGNFVSAYQKVIEMRLKDEGLDLWMKNGIVNSTDFTVPPGKYLVRFVVRDSEGQSMAAQSTGVEIPW